MQRFIYSLLLAFGAFFMVLQPIHSASAQIHVLPKVDETFMKTLKGGKEISNTKACSRIFKTEVDGKGSCYKNGVVQENVDKDSCEDSLESEWRPLYQYDKAKERKVEQLIANRDKDTESYLACAVISGNVRLWMVPYFIRYFADFILAISGSIAILMLIYGGYSYIIGSMSPESEGVNDGKKIIKYAIIGLVLTFSSWALVNVVLAVLTS